ncbi:protein serine/threonine phosphatase 2C [Xylaria bambusicola]|uniref:protein serine/threonine phosphatase 2C n=1 Tax=Xylaria bambusicola TaxID=326684 RepID=UPI0020086FEB|nr:protein serine/threonine phosphatase 2C [Xylaria bambusicola]KAI0517264.1 protein serine/threonine phosphatase 2C [Xylaria bambusicola]
MSLPRGAPKRWSLNDTYGFIASFCETQAQARASINYRASHGLPSSTRRFHQQSPVRCRSKDHDEDAPNAAPVVPNKTQPSPRVIRRGFHTYFVTHLPSSSLHPDSRAPPGPHHHLPRSAAAPHSGDTGAAPVTPPHLPSTRDLTVVRIPLRSAKHHFGATESRGSRPYNEDTNQAGTIDMPAFAKRTPISLVQSAMKKRGEGTSADSPYGDPQIFYFGVFDGHGGTQCSDFLREELHGYIEEAAAEFGLKSSLRRKAGSKPTSSSKPGKAIPSITEVEHNDRGELDSLEFKGPTEVEPHANIPQVNEHGAINEVRHSEAISGHPPAPAKVSLDRALTLQRDLLHEYKSTIGGYFRRFSPPHFNVSQYSNTTPDASISVEAVLTYAFLRADLDFVTAQAQKQDPDDPYVSDAAVNTDEILGKPHHMPPSGHGIGGRMRFKGGSTASVALISTPTPAPFWHPAASSTLLVGHVGDTRILLCETATGLAKPLTSDHHPSSPGESYRLRRFAASFITDSFGEERIQGLANSRAFGDIASKRLGVSAEPEITRIDLGPAQYSFLVLMSDGVSGTLSDQEIVDVVKEAKTPEQGSKDVVAFATEVSNNGDNATCLVVRLGGWERRSEGGLGSLGTKEMRDYRRDEALDPRRGRR